MNTYVIVRNDGYNEEREADTIEEVFYSLSSIETIIAVFKSN